MTLFGWDSTRISMAKQVSSTVSSTGVAAGDGVGLNYRFEQSGMTERNRQQHLYPEGIFPFAYATTTDPLTGKTDGRDSRCTTSNTCPLVMNIDSANEYWVKAGSMPRPTDNRRRSGRRGQLPDLSHLRFATRRSRCREFTRRLRAVREFDRPVPRIARAVRRSGSVDRRHASARQQSTQGGRRHCGVRDR